MAHRPSRRELLKASADAPADSKDGTWILNEDGTQITIQFAAPIEMAFEAGLPTTGECMLLYVSEDGLTLWLEGFQEEAEGRQLDVTPDTAFART